MALLDQTLAVALLAIVVLAPGGAVLALARHRIALDALTALPLAALVTVVLAAPVAALQLAAHLDGHTMAIGWGALTVASLLLLVRAGWSARQQGRWPVTAPSTHGSAGDRRSRSTCAAVGALLALAAVGFVVGGLLDGDALYHAMYAERLATMPDPTFAGSQMFRGGSPHEGYLVPAWHFLVAQAALLGGVDTLDVMRSGAALVLPLAGLAFAACTRAVIRTSWAPWVGGLAFVLVDVLVPTSVPMRGASIAMWPGSVALWIALPLLLAGWFEAARGRRGWLAPIAIATVVLVVLHVTYVLWIGWLAIAWLVAALVLRRRAGALVPVLVAFGAAVASVALYVALSLRVLHARDHVITGVAPDREFFERLLLTGSGTRVAPEVYAAAGWPTMLGILGAAAAALVLRGRAALQASLLTLMVVVAAEVGPVGSVIAHLAGLSHVLRLPQVLRAELGIAVAVVLLAAVAHVALDAAESRRRRIAAVVALAVGTAGSVAASFAWPPTASRFMEAEISRTWATVLVALATLLALVAVIVAIRRAWGTRARDVGEQAARRAPVATLTTRAVAIGVLLMVLGTAPVTLRTVDDVGTRAAQLADRADRRDKVGRLPASMLRDIRALPPRTVVLASLDMAHVIPAVAPVYVSAYPYVHTAATRANRRDSRIRDMRSFAYGWKVPDDWRVEQLERTGAAVVVMPRDTAGARFLQRSPDVVADVRRDGDYVIARVREPAADRAA